MKLGEAVEAREAVVRHRIRVFVACLTVSVTVLLTVGLESAVAAAPPGYVVEVVAGNVTTAGNGTWGYAQVPCPAGTVVAGGGVAILSSSINVAVIESYPIDNSKWWVTVSNLTGTPQFFNAYAVCITQPARWSIQESITTVGPVQQGGASVACPARTKVLGGGVSLSGVSVGSNPLVNSSYPYKIGTGATASYGWGMYDNNPLSYALDAHVYAVCGKLAGYQLKTGAAVTTPPASQTKNWIHCPQLKVPLSGGILSDSDTLAASVADLAPNANGWTFAENNADPPPFSHTYTPYLICDGT